MQKTRSYINQQKQYLYQSLERLQITYWKGAANYIFFYTEPKLKERLLEEGILIRDCSNYIGLEEGYYRIAVKTQEENERLIVALEKILVQTQEKKEAI